MKTTARTALHPAPQPNPGSARPRASPSVESCAAAEGLGTAIADVVQGHRRRLGLAPRAYAARRAWTLGFLLRVLTDPVGLRIGQVAAALEGTGFALTVSRLPTEPLPGTGSGACVLLRARDPEPRHLAPATRLPAHACPCEVVADGVARPA